jgi:adenine-specific DNA-methyltransferase
VTREWDPESAASWAAVLGLVPVPFFDAGRESSLFEQNAVLLDGHQASFHFAATDDAASLLTDEPLAWTWSAKLNHSLVVDRQRRTMLLRRWDAPGLSRRFQLPKSASAANDLLALLEGAAPPTVPDVVLHLLRGFRLIRSVLADADALTSLRTFNLLLTLVAGQRAGTIPQDEISALQTLGDACRSVANAGLETDDSSLAIPPAFFDTATFAFLPIFTRPEPRFSYALDPSLLMRHASGPLYQEAHLLLEREPQLSLPGFPSEFTDAGQPSLGVRFTPSSLARALVQNSFDRLVPRLSERDKLTILDPACGSGVFLVEALRELLLRGYRGRVELQGVDISPISSEMARFALRHLRGDALRAGMNLSIQVQTANSLTRAWGTPDVVVMNPPFVPWQGMTESEKAELRHSLGPLAKGRPDKAMAFVLEAARSLSPGGVLTSVVPAPLLESQHGLQWREAIADLGTLSLLGRFEGFGYFRASLVEPGFFVLCRRVESGKAHTVRMVIAHEGSEDACLRALRRGGPESITATSGKWEIYDSPAALIGSASWLPRLRNQLDTIRKLSENHLTLVQELFDVKQGALTGHNEAFLLEVSEYRQLPAEERAYFRPAAGNRAIQHGALSSSQYVFFPYDVRGLIIRTEAALKKLLPQYYENRLRPRKHALQSRDGIDGSTWWALTRARQWQHRNTPKLISTYFGDKGSFAFDTKGTFVVVHGYGWIWRQGALGEDLSFAYLALLNSTLFQSVLASVCPRLQGGQLNLSARFVNRAFLPNLADTSRYTTDLVAELAALGRKIQTGKSVDNATHEAVAARAFGLPTES